MLDLRISLCLLVALSFARQYVYALAMEPRCSKFDFEEKVLEKLVSLEHTTETRMVDLENKCNKLQEELACVKEELRVKGMLGVFISMLVGFFKD